MSVLASILLLALTRAEIRERMRAPVITQSEGLVQVYAACPEDMRREYQSPVARFAADTVTALYGLERMRPIRFQRPGILVFIGSVRTNLLDVTSTVTTNQGEIVSRIWLKSPGFADLARFREEVVRAFYRRVKGTELSAADARETFLRTDPRIRIAAERAELEAWLAGETRRADGTRIGDEEGLRLLNKVFEPGRASRRDVLLFASHLFLYPRSFDEPFLGRYHCLTFRDALRYAKADPRIRFMALFKQNEPLLFSVGRGEELAVAAKLYSGFLTALAKGELDDRAVEVILEAAERKLNEALEKAT